MKQFNLSIAFLIISSISAFASQDTLRPKFKTDTVFRLVTFGVPDFEKENAINVVGQKWGIEYIRMTGVMQTKKFIDSITIMNAKTEKKILEKYGKKWKKHFDKEVEKEYLIHTGFIKELEKLPEVVQLRDSVSKANQYVEYYVITRNWIDQYEIIINGPGEADGELAMYAYLIYFYNSSSKEFSLISKKRLKMTPHK